MKTSISQNKVIVKAGGVVGPRGETGVGLNSPFTGSANITGSFTLIGDQTITGSLTISGSSTFTNIGPLSQTGASSFNGNTVMTGSLTVSGSSTFTNIGSTIFSGSIIATQGITGSFSGTATSASFAVTASHALFAVSASHEITFEVSSSYAHTASLAANLFGTPSIVVNQVTASGNISSSGEIEANKFVSNGVDIAQFAAGAVQLGGGAVQPAALSGTGITLGISGLNQPVTVVSALTASIISASGDIVGNNLSGTNTGDQNISNLAVTGSNVLFGNITASGNISASGFIKANNGTFNLAGITIDGNTIDYIAPNIRVKNSGLHVFGNGTNGHITASGNISGSSTTTLSVGGDITGGGRGTFTSRVSALADLVTPKILNNTSANNGTVLIDDGLTISGPITASGNISASGDVIGLSGSFANLSVSSLAAIGDATSDTINIKGNTTFTILEGNSGIFRIREEAIDFPILDIKVDSAPGVIFAFDPHLYDNDATGQGKMGIGVPTASIDAKLHLRQLAGSGEPNNLLRIDTGTTPSFRIAKEGNVFTSGSMAVQGGKPITTHTTHFSASLANAGHYLIVGGNLTCSISASTAPVGAEYEFFQTSSAGQFLFETGSGVTLISKNNSLRLAQQGSSAVLKKVGTGTFHLMGDLT